MGSIVADNRKSLMLFSGRGFPALAEEIGSVPKNVSQEAGDTAKKVSGDIADTTKSVAGQDEAQEDES